MNGDRVFDTMMGAERPRLPDKVPHTKADNSPIEIYSVRSATIRTPMPKEIYRRKSEPAQQLISSFGDRAKEGKWPRGIIENGIILG